MNLEKNKKENGFRKKYFDNRYLVREIERRGVNIWRRKIF